MEKTSPTNEILSFKLIGGIEIVAEVTKVNRVQGPVLDGLASKEIVSWEVRRPHILQFTPNGRGGMGLAFIPWTLSNPEIERIEIPRAAVLLTFSPSKHAESQYLRETSGLDLATAQDVLSASRISK